MIAARRFISALQDHLTTELLVPSLNIGVAEPARQQDLPSVVISLAQLVNPSKGLGEHRQLRTGALAERTSLNLDNPILPNHASVSALSADRLTLTLFHGGLVDAEGSDTPLQAADIQVERNGVPFTLVAASPAAGEYRVDTQAGRLIFGAALPADGFFEAEYFIGQWEQVIHPLQGVLRIDAVADSNVDAESLGNLVYDALTDHRILGLRELEVISLGPVTAFNESPTMRVRSVAWQFDFQAIVDLPDASGGVIERIRLLSTHDGEGVEEEEVTLE